jgi:methylated-DNA-protein-cysteine methyltransferase related protein
LIGRDFAVAGSQAFALMKRAVLRAARFVPQGRVTTAAEIGRALNIPARHVAYILAMLTDEERAGVPSHRVVPKDGKFGKPASMSEKAADLVEMLVEEGADFDQRGAIADFASRFLTLPDAYTETRWEDEAALGALEFFGD